MAADAATVQPTLDAKPPRLDAVDFLRGLVMVIMALDHVRDYFSDRWCMDPVDLSTTTPGIFLTRWITHYCAPTFIFLAGTGAFLFGKRGNSKAALSWFLFSRGVWLLFLELTVIKLSWAFYWSPIEHGGGVFWAIGLSMVVMSLLVYLPISAIAVFGVVLVTVHNAWDGLTGGQLGIPHWVWMILHSPDNLTIPPTGHMATFGIGLVKHDLTEFNAIKDVTFGTAYCLIPWVGVMALGYCFGNMLLLEPRKRRRELFTLGASLTTAFILLRAANVYGDPNPWDYQTDPWYTFFSLLNCQKYPPSLLYLLMTIGPGILLLPVLEKITGPVAKFFITFGRVPLFFYLLHIPLIHGVAVLCDFLRFGWSPLATNGPWFKASEAPPDYGFSLPVVYLVWVLVTLVLYPPCVWFARVKQRNKAAWLSYL